MKKKDCIIRRFQIILSIYPQFLIEEKTQKKMETPELYTRTKEEIDHKNPQKITKKLDIECYLV